MKKIIFLTFALIAFCYSSFAFKTNGIDEDNNLVSYCKNMYDLVTKVKSTGSSELYKNILNNQATNSEKEIFAKNMGYLNYSAFSNYFKSTVEFLLKYKKQ